jgi:hypothetical protein
VRERGENERERRAVRVFILTRDEKTLVCSGFSFPSLTLSLSSIYFLFYFHDSCITPPHQQKEEEEAAAEAAE